MIKYSPSRKTLSASLKEERLFCSIEDVKQDVFEHFCRIMDFVSSRPLRFDEVIVEDEIGDDSITGYRHVRFVTVRKTIVGFCGE